MLTDNHLKVLWYEVKSGNVFSNTDIKGGVAVTFRDKKQNFGAIKIFTAFDELNHILKKVIDRDDFKSLSNIAITGYAYHFTPCIYEENPKLFGYLSKGHEYDLKSNVFTKMSDVFLTKLLQMAEHMFKLLDVKIMRESLNGSERIILLTA